MKLIHAFTLSTALLAASVPDDFRSPESVAAGRKLYASACSGCHGPTGEGARGPNLSDGILIRRSTDERLFASIKNGVPGSDMPAFPLTDKSIWALAGFLRSLSAPANESAPAGDQKLGAAIYQRNCAGCHSIRGNGGNTGPDLSDIGGSRTLKQLRESILMPSARIAEGFRGVTLTTRKGLKLQGVAKNYTNFSLQLIDAKGTLHLFTSGDIESVAFADDSPMPTMKLERTELQNLIAFLATQAFEQRKP